MPVDKSPFPKPYLVDPPKASPRPSPERARVAPPGLDPEVARLYEMNLEDYARAVGEAIVANLNANAGNTTTP